MESPGKKWSLIYVSDFHVYYASNGGQVLFNYCVSYLDGKVDFNTELIDLSSESTSIKEQEVCSSSSFLRYSVEWVEQRRKEDEAQLKLNDELDRREEMRKNATWQELLSEVRKKKDYNWWLFGQITSCFLLINAPSLESEITQASFLFLRPAYGLYNNRQTVQKELRLEKRFNQEHIYTGASELRCLIEWINLVTGNSIELPPYQFTILDFETEADYDAHRQEEEKKRQQEEAEWDRKYRIDPFLAIGPGRCSKTNDETTCILIGEPGEQWSVSLDYLIQQAAERGLPFGTKRMG